jgi:hypothetical protein
VPGASAVDSAATCPDGTLLVNGGYTLLYDDLASLTGIVIVTNGPISTLSWQVTAVVVTSGESADASGTVRVQALATCGAG